ncbi:hypothetical protein PMAYCL1PPCAC_10084, partial [Pristionchus mayeri]
MVNGGLDRAGSSEYRMPMRSGEIGDRVKRAGGRAFLRGHTGVLLVVLECLSGVARVHLLGGHERGAAVRHAKDEELENALSGGHAAYLLQLRRRLLVVILGGRRGRTLHGLALSLRVLLLSAALELCDDIGARGVVLILPSRIVDTEAFPLDEILHFAFLVHALVENLLHGVLLALVIAWRILRLLALAHIG